MAIRLARTPSFFHLPKSLIFFFALVAFPLRSTYVAVEGVPASNHHKNHNLKSPATTTESSQHTGFWLSTDVLAAQFRKGCLSTALCHKPTFKLTHTMTLNGETAVMSWPVADGDLIQDHTRSFVTYWTYGDPEDVSLSCQIAGTDPSFGFARVCDETPSRRILNEAAIQQSLVRSRRHEAHKDPQDRSNSEEMSSRFSLQQQIKDQGMDGDRMVVELRGRCFNATLAIRKHLTRCPWCPDPNVHIVVKAGDGEGMQQSAEQREEYPEATNAQRADALFLHNCVILALSGAVVFAFTGLCCAMTIHYRYRRQRHQRKSSHYHRKTTTGTGGLIVAGIGSKKKRLLKVIPPTPNTLNQQQQHQLPLPMGSDVHGDMTAMYHHRANEEPSRYETPWDKKSNNSGAYFPVVTANGTSYGVPPWAMIATSPKPQPQHQTHQLLTPYETSGSSLGYCENGNNNNDAAAYAVAVGDGTTGCQVVDQEQQSNGQHVMVRTATLSRQPPPPPPPPMAFRCYQQQNQQMIQQDGQRQQQFHTFSPNTTSSSTNTRHEDSGLDSI